MRLVAPFLLIASCTATVAAPRPAPAGHCAARLGDARVAARAHLTLRGTAPATQRLDIPAGRYLVEVALRDNDAIVEVIGPEGRVIAVADHPERRTGTRRALLEVGSDTPVDLRVTGEDHGRIPGIADARVIDLSGFSSEPACGAIYESLARADADYAAGHAIGIARPGARGSARHYFLRAREEYLIALQALAADGDRVLEGEVALALAGIEYLQFVNWMRTAEWARRAAERLSASDPYRRARAEALEADAWIEIATEAAPGRPIGTFGVDSTELFRRARERLAMLSQFHLARGERHDAGLQLTNTGLTHLYEGRYSEGAEASLASSRLFASLGETEHAAQAQQNRGLCLWGLGRLPEALQIFTRTVAQMSPSAFPSAYVAALNNTALANYALGNFDESLRWHDRALQFASEIQRPRSEAQSLYGLGVTYYALGDRERARQYLERAVAIRTVALDGRGRMATLRALATVYAEQGRLAEAIAADRDAAALATAPSAAARIRIQSAIHSDAAGHRDEAVHEVDGLLAPGAVSDPLIRAEALLERAVLLREAGDHAGALRDLAAATPRLRETGGLGDEFAAAIEAARDLRALGREAEALVAVEHALSMESAIRLQSANPELRMQLQAPLRPAYDLKLDLLWERRERERRAGHLDEVRRLAAVAFDCADASRAQTFAEVAAQRYSPAVRTALAPRFAEREALYREIAARRFALDARQDRSGSDDPRTHRLLDDIAGLERKVATINAAIATRAASAAQSTRNRRGAELPADTGLLAYWLGASTAYAWAVTPAGTEWIRLGSPAAIGDAARAFHDSLTRLVDTPLERRLQNAEALHGLIVDPLDHWLANYRRWLVIPDGALAYVPFAALRARAADRVRYVVEQHDVALTPARWMLRETPSAATGRRRLLVVADPIYERDDERIAPTASGAGARLAPSAVGSPPEPALRRLPWTAREASDIAAEFKPSEVVRLVGPDATRARLLALNWSQFRFIHVATRGLLDAASPPLSALMLGRYDAHGAPLDAAVRVADLSLRSFAAELVVFSACETALGKDVASEGLVGIGYTALARGAQSVVASLWRVPDETSARLMTGLYRHLLRDSNDAPAALAAAMREELARAPQADPALWAPFQVSVVTTGRAPSRGHATSAGARRPAASAGTP